MTVPQTRLAAVLVAISLTAPLAAQTVWHVDDDAAPGGDGSRWATAFSDLQSALNVVGMVDQIWVAAGTYIPSELRDPLDRRSATFEIPVDIKIYGGFAGHEISLEQRAGLFDQTVLSGDLGVQGVHGDNAYNVVLVPENPVGNIPSRLDGFTVTGGNANGSVGPLQRGGGVHVTMTLTGSGFTPILELAHCTLRDNRGLRGAGLAVDNFGLVEMSHCRLTGNEAEIFGGAVLVQTGTLWAHNCRLASNTSEKGGAVYLNSISADSHAFGPYVRFVNCLFHDNEAARGGVAYLSSNAMPVNPGIGTWINCTLDNNRAAISGGAFFAKASGTIPARLTIRNSILWTNIAPAHPQVFGPTAEITYSDVRGGWSGTGNFSADPLFLSPATGDYHTLLGSPAHDAGDNDAMLSDIVDLDGNGDTSGPVSIDLDGGRRFLDDPTVPDSGTGTPPIIDVGAYEY